MMGERRVGQDALFYEFSLERHVPVAIDRPVCRPRRGTVRTGAVLQRDGTAFDRSGADDPDADRRLLLRHPLGAAVVRGGPSEPGLSLVLPARSRWRGARSLDLLEEPAWPFPRQRSAAAVVPDRAAALHRRRFGWWRRLCRRRQPDPAPRERAHRVY